MSIGAFSVGCPFNYWSKYISEDHKQIDNEYYVEPKYSNFKEEIMNYQYLNLKQHSEALTKAKVYMDTVMVKSINKRNHANRGITQAPHYNISRGENISMGHITSVILYTDCTDLSCHFTSSFRKLETWETLESMKNRNRNYGWLSKYLMEAVQVYGDTGVRYCAKFGLTGVYGSEPHPPDCEYSHIGGTLIGPFYCGMSTMLHMPQFSILLLSPTSTSGQLEVAMKFSGESGIIIEISNYIHPAWRVMGLDVSTISRYKEEDERCAYLLCILYGRIVMHVVYKLIFGGEYPINVESIWIMENQSNLSEVIMTLTVLDLALSGEHAKGQWSTAKGKILRALFNYATGKNSEIEASGYIFNMNVEVKSLLKAVESVYNVMAINRSLVIIRLILS